MENSTKALLIAAAILIAIVVIALGIRLLSSSNDTSKQADDVAKQILNTSSQFNDDITKSMGNIIFYIKFGGESNTNGVTITKKYIAKKEQTWGEWIKDSELKDTYEIKEKNWIKITQMHGINNKGEPSETLHRSSIY